MSCTCTSRIYGGDCAHTVSPEDILPTDAEMRAEGYELVGGVWHNPGVALSLAIGEFGYELDEHGWVRAKDCGLAGLKDAECVCGLDYCSPF